MPLERDRFDVNLSAGGAGRGAPTPARTDVFRLLILSDLGAPLSDKPFDKNPVRIDRDNFDEVLARLGVLIRLAGVKPDGGDLVIPIKELDDFGPDRLYANVEVFQHLRGLRRRLDKPATFAEAAAEVQSWSGGSSAPVASTAAAPAPLSAADALAQMLGGSIPGLGEATAAVNAPPQVPGISDWNRYISAIVAPYELPKADPRLSDLIARVDTATSAVMRQLLHHPQFQAVESAWRSVYTLTRALETDEALKVYLLHVPQTTFVNDLTASDRLTASGTYRLWVERPIEMVEGPAFTLVVGNYHFAPTVANADTLTRVALIAAKAQTTFLAATDARVAGCPSLLDVPDPLDWTKPAGDDAAAWAALRTLPECAHLGLALPRVLMRVPYGKATNPIESFAFEELPENPNHEHFLWGNPAFAWARLLGTAFAENGWRVNEALQGDIEDLPLALYKLDGESEMKPVAEVLLSDRAEEHLRDTGVAVLRSHVRRANATFAALPGLAGGRLKSRWQ
jgi:type VI secretion system protein ImpC